MVSTYAILFASSFLAATVLPFYSEFTLVMQLMQGDPALLLLLVATVGNTLGSLINWLLGSYLLHYKDRRWFYFSDRQIARGQDWFNRYGLWTLLFAWLPVGGDVLTLIAGVMKVRLHFFIALVAVGKGIRYAAIIWLLYPLGMMAV